MTIEELTKEIMQLRERVAVLEKMQHIHHPAPFAPQTVPQWPQFPYTVTCEGKQP